MGRNTFYFIAKTKVLKNKRVTYVRLICSIRPQKKETHRVHLTAGGNLVDYPGNTSTLTIGIVTIKNHLAPYNYKPVTYAPGLWINTSNNITFTLIVGDFGVSYSEDAHL